MTPKEFAALREKADQGDYRACLRMSFCCDVGIMTPKNPIAAAYWLKQADKFKPGKLPDHPGQNSVAPSLEEFVATPPPATTSPPKIAEAKKEPIENLLASLPEPLAEEEEEGLASSLFHGGGKWLIFTTADQLEAKWQKVVCGMEEGHLLRDAKFMYKEGVNPVIVVYTKDCQDVEDVIRVLEYLEREEIKDPKQVIYYKSNLQTLERHYSHQHGDAMALAGDEHLEYTFGFKASIYSSESVYTKKTPQKLARPRRVKKQKTISEFYQAVEAGRMDVVTEKLATTSLSDAEVHEKNNAAETLLHAALRSGNNAMLALLLKQALIKKVLLNKGAYGKTPLHLAVALEKIDCVATLVAEGCDLMALDAKKKTALHYAARQRNIPISAYLLEHCPELFLIADQFGRRACETILESDNQLVGKSALTMRLHVKPDLPEAEIFSLFLDRLTAKELQHTDQYNKTILHHAVKTLSTEGLRKLLEKFSPDLINHRDNYGKTALIEASIYGRSADVALLLEHGADPHVVSQEQHTAFQEWVLRYGKAAAIDLFTGVMSKTLCEQQAASILNPILPYFLSKPSSFYDDQSDFFSNPGTTTQATQSKPEESLAKRMRNEVKDEVVPQAASDQVTALMLSPG